MTETFSPNPGQQQVLDHKGGPLLVVAGAGTGKTRVIVEKISQLLKNGVAPSEILAVTFTEKAAAEMEERVILNQQGLLLDLPVMTYNGYGNALLKEYSSEIGIPRSFRLLGPQAQIVFFRERIDEFELDYFLPLTASPDGIIETILGLFSKLKQHIVSADRYKTYAAQLSENDEAEKLEKQKHTELAAAFETYLRLCRQENVIDYDDQIYLTIQLLESRPNVRRELRARYHTIFVDEFQDTNPMQSRLIDLLVNDSQNLIVVGDDDQAIYGFRGATIDNILSFKDRYPKSQEAALTKNYRSHQQILDGAYSLIQHNNPDRLESSLNINKKLTSDSTGNPPELHRFDTTDTEIAWLVDDIAAQIKRHKTGKPISLAVLTRSNPSADIIHRALENAGVPHRVVGSRPDLYRQPLVRILIELARPFANRALSQ